MIENCKIGYRTIDDNGNGQFFCFDDLGGGTDAPTFWERL